MEDYTVTLRCCVPASLVSTLKTRAGLAGVSVSELVRDVLSGWLADAKRTPAARG